MESLKAAKFYLVLAVLITSCLSANSNQALAGFEEDLAKLNGKNFEPLSSDLWFAFRGCGSRPYRN